MRLPALEGRASLVQAMRGDDAWNEGAILVAMAAAQAFEARHGRKAGETQAPGDQSWELDIPQLQQATTALASELGLSARCVKDDLLLEVCRCAGGSLHVMASIIGGIAAQEAIKVLLRQFEPVKGVLIYDGVRSTSAVLTA